jgi:hypothetical protein
MDPWCGGLHEVHTLCTAIAFTLWSPPLLARAALILTSLSPGVPPMLFSHGLHREWHRPNFLYTRAE